jgi:hypothetical protein
MSLHASQSLMTPLDFRAIDEMDPSLADGHRLMYDREVPMELRTQEGSQHPQDVGTLESLRVKVLCHGEDSRLMSLRIELSSDNDLFFHFGCAINAVGFRQLQQDQRLVCEFAGFAAVLLKMLTRCAKEPETFLAILILTADGSAALEFIQNLEYKFVELLVLPYQESPEHVIRQQISYRYNSLRSRVSMMQTRLQDISEVMKQKNPSLLPRGALPSASPSHPFP